MFFYFSMFRPDLPLLFLCILFLFISISFSICFIVSSSFSSSHPSAYNYTQSTFYSSVPAPLLLHSYIDPLTLLPVLVSHSATTQLPYSIRCSPFPCLTSSSSPFSLVFPTPSSYFYSLVLLFHQIDYPHPIGPLILPLSYPNRDLPFPDLLSSLLPLPQVTQLIMHF